MRRSLLLARFLGQGPDPASHYVEPAQERSSWVSAKRKSAQSFALGRHVKQGGGEKKKEKKRWKEYEERAGCSSQI